MREINQFNELLRNNGYWVYAAGIGSPDTAHLIDNRGGAGIHSVGYFFDSNNFYSGFWIVDVPNEDSAIKLATEGSKACNRKVELRPFLT